MAVDVGTGFVEIIPKTDKFAAAISSSIQQIGASTSGQFSAVTQAAEVGITALGVGAVAAIGKGISATTEWAGEIRSLQSVTGLAAEDASGLAAAGNELGISTSTLNTAFGTLAKNIANGSTNLEKYGIATKDASGATLPFNEILANIADKYASLPSQVDKAAFAQNVFGRSGKALIPLLAQGADGLQEMTDRAGELGLVMSQDDLDAARQLTLAQRELSEAFRGASITIGKSFVPAATEIVHVFSDMLALLQKIPAPVLSQIVSFTALAGVLSVAGKAFAFVKSGLAELPGAASNAAGAQAEVAASASDAAEATQTLSSVEQASVAIKSEAASANTALAVSSVAAAEGEQAVGAAATVSAGQLQLFDTAAVSAAGSTDLLAGASGAAAGAFAVLNAPIVGLVAPLFALYKGLVAAHDEITAISHGNVTGVFNALSDGLKIVGISLPKVTDPATEFRGAIDQLTASIKDGTIPTVDAAAQVLDQLAQQYGFTITDSHALAQQMFDQAGVTEDTTAVTKDLTAATHDASTAAQDHARALQDEYNAIATAAGGLLGLASALQQQRTDQMEVNRLEREGKTDTNAYRDAVRQLISDHIAFRGALQDVTQDLRSGNITLDQAKRQLIEYGLQAGVAKGKVKDAFASIKASIQSIPSKVTTTIVADTSQATASLANLQSKLAGLQARYSFTVTETVPHHAAGGIVTRPELALVGEAGPEAIIPLSKMNSVTQPIAGPSRQPVRIVGTLRMTDWRQGLVDLDGELAWEELARTS